MCSGELENKVSTGSNKSLSQNTNVKILIQLLQLSHPQFFGYVTRFPVFCVDYCLCQCLLKCIFCKMFVFLYFCDFFYISLYRLHVTGRRSRDSMVVEFPSYLCNQSLSPLMLWVRTPLRRGVLDTTLCDQVCYWLATGRWFSPGTTVSSTNKTEILLKVALNTISHTCLSEISQSSHSVRYLSVKPEKVIISQFMFLWKLAEISQCKLCLCDNF